MRDYADLPNDLPRPLSPPERAPAPKPPYRHPRLVAQGVWEDPMTGRWSCYVKPPASCRHANIEMMLRDRFDGDEVAVQEMIDKEALCAEDAAIRRLDAETVDAEARFKKTLIRGEVGEIDRFRIHPGNVDYECRWVDLFKPSSARTALLETHLQHERSLNPMMSISPMPFQNEKPVTALQALMEEYERRLMRTLCVPQNLLTGKWD